MIFIGLQIIHEKNEYFYEKKVARYTISAIMLMISGEGMEKYIVVKQKHLYTNERYLMYEGQAFFSNKDGCLRLSYKEKDSDTKVTINAKNDELMIERKGELITRLSFQYHETTTGSVMSEFGMFDIGVYTHKYIKKENIIAIEYDILSGDEVTDGYRIIWVIKEDLV